VLECADQTGRLTRSLCREASSRWKLLGRVQIEQDCLFICQTRFWVFECLIKPILKCIAAFFGSKSLCCGTSISKGSPVLFTPFSRGGSLMLAGTELGLGSGFHQIHPARGQLCLRSVMLYVPRNTTTFLHNRWNIDVYPGLFYQLRLGFNNMMGVSVFMTRGHTRKRICLLFFFHGKSAVCRTPNDILWTASTCYLCNLGEHFHRFRR